ARIELCEGVGPAGWANTFAELASRFSAPMRPGRSAQRQAHHRHDLLLGLRGQRDAAPGELRAGHDLLRPVPRDLGDLAHRGGDPLVQRHGTGPWLEQKGVQLLAPVSPGAAPGPCYGPCPSTAAGTAAGANTGPGTATGTQGEPHPVGRGLHRFVEPGAAAVE